MAVVVHGGCWLSIANNDYIDRVAERLTQAGWATWNLEFRRIDEPGGAWPGIFRDVAAGTDHLRSVAKDRPLDLDRVVTVGHSSGGHLALWLASRHRIPAGAELHDDDPLPIQGVVALGGASSASAATASWPTAPALDCSPTAGPPSIRRLPSPRRALSILETARSSSISCPTVCVYALTASRVFSGASRCSNALLLSSGGPDGGWAPVSPPAEPPVRQASVVASVMLGGDALPPRSD